MKKIDVKRRKFCCIFDSSFKKIVVRSPFYRPPYDALMLQCLCYDYVSEAIVAEKQSEWQIIIAFYLKNHLVMNKNEQKWLSPLMEHEKRSQALSFGLLRKA